MCDPVSLISAVAGGVGALMQGSSAVANMGNISSMNSAQQQAIGLQQQQFELQNQQQQRQILRNESMARATALSNSVNQGGGTSSSGVLGGMGSISTNAGVAYNMISQGNTLGVGIFNAERQYATANMNYQQTAAIGQMGGALLQASPALGRLGATAYGYMSNPYDSGWSNTYTI